MKIDPLSADLGEAVGISGRKRKLAVTTDHTRRRTGLRFILLATAFALVVGRLSAVDLADYKEGDTAEADIVAPISLRVVDLEATAALKKKEADEIPFLFLFKTNQIEEAEGHLRAVLAKTRLDFVEAYNVSGHKPADPKNFPLPGFDRFVQSYESRSQLPLSSVLARAWAKGEPDEFYIAPAVARLHEMLQLPIRADTLPAGIDPGTTVCLIPVAQTNEIITAQSLQQRGIRTNAGGIQSLTGAKIVLENRFPENHALGEYLGSFVHPSCIPDWEQTVELRAQSDRPLVVADNYTAGQIIVRRGAIIDKKCEAAIHQLVQRTRPKPSQAALAERVEGWPRQLRFVTSDPKVIVSGIVLVLFGVGAVVWVGWRRSRPSDGPSEIWRRRALAAEQQAHQARAIARSGLIANVATLLSNSFVGRLLSQRAGLLKSQHKTATELEQLEARLEAVQTQMEGRLHAYEQQIAELEEQLNGKGEGNRTRIKTEIESIRQRWESESSTSWPGRN